MSFPDNLIKWIKKECNNDETCVMIAFILIGVLLCFLFKDQVSGYLNFAPVNFSEETPEPIIHGGGDDKQVNKTESRVGLELKPPQRSKSSLEHKLKIMDSKPKMNGNGAQGKFQRAGLNIQESMIALPFDEVWNPGFKPLDMMFKESQVDQKKPLGPMGPDRPMRPGGQPKGGPSGVASMPKGPQIGGPQGGPQGGAQGDFKVILVYAPWCGHSKKMLPDYEKVKSEFHGKTINGKKVSIIMYDSDVDKDKVKEYGVKGFPTLFVEDNGERKPFPHRTNDKISEFLNNI